MYIADLSSRVVLPRKKGAGIPLIMRSSPYKQWKPFYSELEHINFAEYLTVSDLRLQQIPKLTVQDEVLQVLKTPALIEWPDQK